VGKDEEYAEFVSARWLTLVRAALALGCTLSEAEDLAQTTMVKVYVAWSKVVRADHRDAYVSRMLVNAHRDSHRRRRETPVAAVPDSASADATTTVDSADAIGRAVSRLSQGQREVIALRYFVRLTEPEIAAALGIAPGTVKSRLSRALDALSADAGLAGLHDGGTP
jgi:RNA polymerase sigma-70 factor (sigma-E family)